MKFKIYGSAFMLTVLLSACTAAKPAPEPKSASSGAAQTETETKSAVSEAELQYVKALREVDKNKRDGMFKAVRRALLEEAANRKTPKAHLLLGYMADLGQGMSPDGIQAARHYRIAADSGLAEAKIALAEFWRRNEIFLDEAVKQITSIPDYEDNPNALCTLGAIYYAMYENDKGYQILKQAYTSEKRLPNTRLDVLKILHRAFEKYFRGNNFDAALKELRRADELEPGNHLTAYLMGLVEFRRGSAAEAEKMFNLSLKRNPAVPETYRELAFLKARSGRFEEAVDDAKIAYAISGRRIDFERALLEIYVLAKRSGDLLRMTGELLKSQPERKDLRLIRVSVHQINKDYQKAYDDLLILMQDKKLAHDPALQETFANISSALGKYADAVKANEAILKQGFRPVPALNLAELYIVTGRFDKAAELLNHPDFKNQKDLLIRCVVPYLEACALLASGKDAEEPVKRFKAALPAFLAAGKDPGEWDVTMFKAWLKTAELPEEAKKTIARLTESFAVPVSGPVSAPRTQPGKTPSAGKETPVK